MSKDFSNNVFSNPNSVFRNSLIVPLLSKEEQAADLRENFWNINNNDELAMEIYSMMLEYNITRDDVIIYHIKYIAEEHRHRIFFEKARLQPKTPFLNLVLPREEVPINEKYENYLKANGAAGIVWAKLIDYLKEPYEQIRGKTINQLPPMERIYFYNKLATDFLHEAKPFVPKAKAKAKAKGGSYKNKSRKVRRTRRAKTSKK